MSLTAWKAGTWRSGIWKTGAWLASTVAQPETPRTVASGGSRPQREARPIQRHDDDEAFLLAVLL